MSEKQDVDEKVCVNISFTHLWHNMPQQTKYIISKIMCAEGDWIWYNSSLKDCEILTPFPLLAIKIPCIICICLTQIHSFIHCWNTMYYKVDQFPAWLSSGSSICNRKEKKFRNVIINPKWDLNRSPVDLKSWQHSAEILVLASSVVLMDPKPLHIQYNIHAVTCISHFLFRYY